MRSQTREYQLDNDGIEAMSRAAQEFLRDEAIEHGTALRIQLTLSTLSPKAEMTRAQAAVMLLRYGGAA